MADVEMKRTTVMLALLAGALVPLAGCGEAPEETPPTQLAGSPFHYPEELWDANLEGETVLRILVGEEGQVDSVHVERTSGYPAFDSAAVSGAYDLRFQPGTRGEEPVSAWVLLPVQFQLPAREAAAPDSI